MFCREQNVKRSNSVAMVSWTANITLYEQSINRLRVISLEIAATLDITMYFCSLEMTLLNKLRLAMDAQRVNRATR